MDSHVTGPILLGDVTAPSAVCAAILPRLAFSLACRASPKSRRLAPAGFTKSSMTASASSLGATLPACACHAERLQLRRSLSPHRRGDRRTARQFIRGRWRGNCCRRKRAIGVRPDPLSAAGPCRDAVRVRPARTRWRGFAAQRRSKCARPRSRAFYVVPMPALPSIDTSRPPARASTGTPARSAAKASCRSGSARHIASGRVDRLAQDQEPGMRRR